MKQVFFNKMTSKMKILLVGEFGSGKTRAYNRLLDKPKVKDYEPTKGAQVGIYTNAKGTEIQVWDIAGNDTYPGLRDGYFIGADVCFVFGRDMSWIRDLERTVPNAKIYIYSKFDDFKQTIESLG